MQVGLRMFQLAEGKCFELSQNFETDSCHEILFKICCCRLPLCYLAPFCLTKIGPNRWLVTQGTLAVASWLIWSRPDLSLKLHIQLKKKHFLCLTPPWWIFIYWAHVKQKFSQIKDLSDELKLCSQIVRRWVKVSLLKNRWRWCDSNPWFFLRQISI